MWAGIGTWKAGRGWETITPASDSSLTLGMKGRDVVDQAQSPGEVELPQCYSRISKDHRSLLLWDEM